ncbi:MAG: glycosyltransferase family 4 protein [Planctomycetota bacterium]
MGLRFLIISCVFPPEPVVSAQTSAQLAEWLAQQGHTVTVITNFPNRPGGKLYAGYHRRWARMEQHNGIRVVRCFTTLSGKSSLLSRFLENLSFGMSSGCAVLRETRPDVIYANSWPIFATGILCWIAQVKRIPLVISVQDIYPEALMVQGRLATRHPIYRWLECADQCIARHSQAILVISRRFQTIYTGKRGVPADRVHLIPNWADQRKFHLSGQGQEIRRQHGIPLDSFLAVYGGNIGAAAGVETVIEAFRYIQDRMHLLVAGDGSHLPACQRLAAGRLSERIHFHSPWPAEQTAQVYQAADVLILPTRGDQSLVSVPSKMLGYMFSGKPILTLAVPGSDLVELVDTSNCGWVVEPDYPQKLADKLLEVARMSPKARRAYGESGRAYALKHLTAEVCLPQVGEVLMLAVKHAVE